MQRKALLEIIADQRQYPFPEKIIEREYIKPELLKNKDKFIQIFSGVRRGGKSTLLQYIRQKRKEKDYFLNFDDERLIDFQVDDFQKLYEIFLEQFGEQHAFYFDEIQNIKGWERFIRRLHDAGNKIFITGSNARLLSRELGTHLTGRYLTAELYPFSFREYLKFKDHFIDNLELLATVERAKIKNYFSDYLAKGGFPEFLQTNNTEYLKQLYENILYRDILVRYKLPHEKVLKELGLYLASNIGKLFSFNKLKTLLGVGSATSIKEYLSYFKNSYLFFSITKYDYSLKKQVYAPKKVYCVDPRLAKEIGFRFSQERGRYLENAVFLELKRKDRDIYYHYGQRECDFIVQKGKKIVEAIQVTSNLENPETREREKEGLIEAIKAYNLKKGLILTENEEGEEVVAINGKKRRIIILPVWKWLLDERFFSLRR